jgi:CelD/BcsL family acetyltransferase involved in cellulose biosynthesis
MNCQMAYGPEARGLIGSQAFALEWQALQDCCPWATSFTAVPFATTWYRVYRDVYEPVLVWERNLSGRLTGLFLLACSTRTGDLVPVGSRDAEYDAWLAEADNGDAFIEAALDRLAERFPQATLRFQYLAAGAPLAWTSRGRWASRCELEPLSRALREVADGSSFRESLKKKSNKSRYNRLERMGKLELVRVTSPDEFAGVLDVVADLADFRHGAVHATFPFRKDPLRKQLYLELMRIPRLLHVTTLRLSGELLAAHIGFCNRGQVLLGVITHSPIHAEQSPGKLLMLLLGLELAQEGVPTFDLTPGTASGYKERFATHHDQIHALTVRFDPNQARRRRIELELADAGRAFLTALRMKPGRVSLAAGAALKVLRSVFDIRRLRVVLRQHWWNTREMCVYGWVPCQAINLPDTRFLVRDDVASLLAFNPSRRFASTSPHQFLSAALARLEEGSHVYTRVESGHLVFSGWMKQAAELLLPDFDQTVSLPPNSVVIWDCRTHQDFRDGGLRRAGLHHMLGDARAIPGAEGIFMVVPGEDLDFRNLVEELGFAREKSYWKRTRLWREANWQDGAILAPGRPLKEDG